MGVLCAHGVRLRAPVHQGNHRPPPAPLSSGAGARRHRALWNVPRDSKCCLPPADLMPTARCPPLSPLSGASSLELELTWTARPEQETPAFPVPTEAPCAVNASFLLHSHTAAAVRGAGSHLLVIGATNN